MSTLCTSDDGKAPEKYMQMYTRRRDVKSFPSLRHTERSFAFGFPGTAITTLNVLIASRLAPAVEFPKCFIYACNAAAAAADGGS